MKKSPENKGTVVQGKCNALLYDWDSGLCSLGWWSGATAAPHTGLRLAWASSVHPGHGDPLHAWYAIDNNLYGNWDDKVMIFV